MEHVRSPGDGEDFWGAPPRKAECAGNERSHHSWAEKVKVDLERNLFCFLGGVAVSGEEHLFTKEAVI